MQLKTQKRYFLQNLIIFVIPIFALSTLFFYQNIVEKREQIDAFHLSLLTQFASETDLMLSTLENQSLEIASTNESLSFADYTVNERLSLLEQYQKDFLNDEIDLLYYPRQGLEIYYRNSLISYDYFEKSVSHDPSLSFAGFFTALNTADTEQMISLGGFSEQNIYSIALIHPTPISASEKTGSFAFLIQQSFMDSIAEKYFSGFDDHLYILDAANTVLYNNSNLLTDNALRDIVWSHRLGVFEYSYNGEKYVAMRTVSTMKGYHFISVIPASEFYGGIHRANFILGLIVALLVIFSVLMAAILSQNFYRGIVAEQTKNKQMVSELQTREQEIQQLVLNRLLNGTIKDDDTKNMEYNLRCAKLNFSLPLFTVLLCELTDLQLTLEAYDEIIQCVRAQSCDTFHCYATKHIKENRLAVIFNHTEQVDYQASFLHIVSYALGKKQVLISKIGCGCAHPSPFFIDNSHVEAMTSIHAHMNNIKPNCYYFTKECRRQSQEYKYPYVEQALIEQSIHNGLPDIALQSIDELLAQIDLIAPSIIIQRCLRYDLINMLVKIADNIHATLSIEEISQLSSWESTEGVRTQMAQVIHRLCTQYQLEQTKRYDTLRHSIIEYTQEHFNENNLSLNDLASHFNLSYTYISKVFKEEIGVSFISYITQLRFDYVKKQLVETDNHIKDIVYNAGYIDVANFTRKFKASEGVTPGQYREHALK